MRLRLGATDDTRATLYLDGKNLVIIEHPNAPAVARAIQRAVNRDYMFDALIAALTPFKSTEIGDRLIEVMDIREFRNAEAAEARLRQLIDYVDATLEAAEYAEPKERAS